MSLPPYDEPAGPVPLGSRATSSLLRAKRWLTSVVAALYLAACLLPGFWGRGGLLKGGIEVRGWDMVFLWWPISLPSLLAMILSVRWLWRDRFRRAFVAACINLFVVSLWLLGEGTGDMELRSGYYCWLVGVAVWAVGAGYLGSWQRRKKPATPDIRVDELG